MFSEIQQDDKRLKLIYIKLIQQVVFWITPIMLVAIVIAEPLFRLLLTEKWLPSVPYFRILCIGGIVMPLNTYNLNILLVKGLSAKYLRLKIVRNLLIILGALLFIPFGIYGLIYSIVIINILTLFINSYYSGRLIGLNINIQFLEIYKILLLGLLTFVLAVGIDFYIKRITENDYIKISFITIASFIFYFGIAKVLKFSMIYDLYSFFKIKKR